MADFAYKFIYEKIFENSLLRSTGDGFQQLVYRLLDTLYPNFEKIDVQGSLGDRKNDGYIRGQGVFYQVYGPKDSAINTTSQSTAVKKMPEDFYVLKKHIDSGHWEPITKYIFVFKVWRGTYPEVMETLSSLEKANPAIGFEICDIDHLLRLFNQLTLDKMAFVTNCYVPEPDFDIVSFQVMGEIINHLNSLGSSMNLDITKDPPDFEKKIMFNHLARIQADNLRVASYKIQELDDYLSSFEGNDTADYLCSIFKKLYSESLIQYPDNPIMQFQYILESCHLPHIDKRQLQIVETNSYVMIAKYFETCDIFEEPTDDSQKK
ncbi:MAG: hypothetical protein HFG42_16490 [Lachnospiraceae bacterium]|jgi:hypothetical protein|nr:hypothetical protein [Lachnospiraceae bacterium]